jgi:hypothetical protein
MRSCSSTAVIEIKATNQRQIASVRATFVHVLLDKRGTELGRARGVSGRGGGLRFGAR